MGVDVSTNLETDLAKKSLFGKIFIRLAKVLDWLAKGQEGNLPCTG
jgi:hypothetical protein